MPGGRRPSGVFKDNDLGAASLWRRVVERRPLGTPADKAALSAFFTHSVRITWHCLVLHCCLWAGTTRVALRRGALRYGPPRTAGSADQGSKRIPTFS